MKPAASRNRHIARIPILIATVFDQGLIEVFEYHHIEVGRIMVESSLKIIPGTLSIFRR